MPDFLSKPSYLALDPGMLEATLDVRIERILEARGALCLLMTTATARIMNIVASVVIATCKFRCHPCMLDCCWGQGVFLVADLLVGASHCSKAGLVPDHAASHLRVVAKQDRTAALVLKQARSFMSLFSPALR